MRITNNSDELLISIPKGLIDPVEIQKIIDLVRYKTIVSKSKASKENIEELTNEINESLSKKNKH